MAEPAPRPRLNHDRCPTADVERGPSICQACCEQIEGLDEARGGPDRYPLAEPCCLSASSPWDSPSCVRTSCSLPIARHARSDAHPLYAPPARLGRGPVRPGRRRTLRRGCSSWRDAAGKGATGRLRVGRAFIASGRGPISVSIGFTGFARQQASGMGLEPALRLCEEARMKRVANVT